MPQQPLFIKPELARGNASDDLMACPDTGCRSSNSLWIGSSPRRSPSLASGYPHAIPKTRCATRSGSAWVTRVGSRESARQAANRVVRPRRQSAACDRTARRPSSRAPDQRWPSGASGRDQETGQSVVSSRRSTQAPPSCRQFVWQRLSITRRRLSVREIARRHE